MSRINEDSRRFYTARMGVDLFGEMFLEKITGSMDSNRGRKMLVSIDSATEGVTLINIICQKRKKNGYKIVWH